jgi:mono/diheme cytochrome c family protein
MSRMAALAVTAIAFATPVAAADPPRFERDVKPILAAKCLKCHGAENAKASLDLRTPAAIKQGGETGPAIISGNPAKSLLLEQVTSGAMPPGKGAKLTAAEIATLKAWVEAGAPADEAGTVAGPAAPTHWAFLPPKRPPVPPVPGAKHHIDAFLLAKLSAKGLAFSPEADRLTLLRRVTVDLTGLPPTPAEQEAFLADKSADAYEKVVDRLLASPRYGERWGRHWLDAAGYADSEGILDADYVRSAAWRYRDWVIRALNADMPYDKFLREQIAGDEYSDYWTHHRNSKELPPAVIESITATGFLRCASDTSRPDFVNIKNAPGYYYQTLEDTQAIVGTAILGLTVQCAKCHSHKFDPIPQADYYRVQAVFMSGYRPNQWVPQVQRRLSIATAAEEKDAAAINAEVAKKVGELRKQQTELRREFAAKLFEDRLAKLPVAIREDVRVAINTEATKRTEVQKYLAEKFTPELKPADAQLPAVLTKEYPEYATKAKVLDTAIAAEEAKKRTFAEVRAMYDLPGEPKTPVLRRGDYTKPGPEVTPGVLSCIAAPKPFVWTPPAKDAPTSGRRRAFAEWITQPNHPLTARVMVNRVWMLHFGEGLVRTPENFGLQGAKPTHAELLDWLAMEFEANGWSLKKLHRLILTSAAYRQASTDAETRVAERKADPDNTLLWRQRMRRVEAEVMRDSVLAVAGTLNEERFGPPVAVRRLTSDEVVTNDDAAGRRRSIYLLVRRSEPVTLLQLFDQPRIETNCTRRNVSTVASQALTLLNSETLTRQAEAFADRLLKESPDDPASAAIRLVFCRPARPEELAKLNRFLTDQTKRHAQATDAKRRALADLCHILLCANEFVYVD